MATQTDVLEKVHKLIMLANDDVDSEESRNAATKALAMMKEHKLVLVPQTEIDRISTMIGDARALAAKQESAAMQKMALGAVAGFMLAKKGLL